MSREHISPERLANLRKAAQNARSRGHSPYSGFTVLAAVESPVGVFGGVNVENVNYSLTKHAEEVAILAALMSGAGQEDPHWLRTLYVTGASLCGSCRQFAAEFGTPETLILVDRLPQNVVKKSSLATLGRDKIEEWRLGELLPAVFDVEELSSAGKRVSSD